MSVLIEKVLGVFHTMIIDEKIFDFLVVDFQKGSFNPELNLILLLFNDLKYFADDSGYDTSLILVT